MPSESNRRNFVPCDCPRHKGASVHYKTRQRCYTRIEGCDAPMRVPRERVQNEPEKKCDPMSDSSDSEAYNAGDREQHFSLNDDIDRLCFEIFANHVDSKTTEDCVTQHLVTIRATLALGNYLPPEKRARIPRDFHALRAIFTPHMPRLIRIPVCPGECQLLDDVTPTTNYVCECNGVRNIPWR